MKFEEYNSKMLFVMKRYGLYSLSEDFSKVEVVFAIMKF